MENPEFKGPYEKNYSTYKTCDEEAGDSIAEWKECAKTYMNFFRSYCSSEIMDPATSCRIPPSAKFEDFALDLAEELPFSDACKAMQEELTEKLTTCAKDAASKNPVLGLKLLMAQNTFETCVEDAGDDFDELVKCWKPFAGVLIESGCSAEVKDVEDTCGVPSFEFEDFFLDLAEDEELESTAYATYLRG